MGGKSDGVGAAVWNAVPLLGGWGVGGDGLKVIVVRFTSQTLRKRQSSIKTTVPFGQGSVCTICSVKWERQAL